MTTPSPHRIYAIGEAHGVGFLASLPAAEQIDCSARFLAGPCPPSVRRLMRAVILNASEPKERT